MQDVAGHDLRGCDSPSSAVSTRPSAILAVVGAVVIGVVIGIVETAEVADVPKLAGLPIGSMTGIAFLVGAACSMASGIIGMFVARQGQRPDGLGGAAQPRRGGPGRDARRRRLRASSSSPCRCSACGASSRSTDRSSAT